MEKRKNAEKKQASLKHMNGHAPWAEQGDVVGELEIEYQKELYIFNAQNPVLVKSSLTSDSGSTTEAG